MDWVILAAYVGVALFVSATCSLLEAVLTGVNVMKLRAAVDIQQNSFVSADKAGSWSAILDDLVDESHRSRGASELSAQLADGTPLPSIRFRDLGNAQVGDRRRTPTGLSRDAVLSAVGLTAVKFVVRHRP